MKFGYSYKTPDGQRHEAEFVAKTKEEVFAHLRAEGVKPIKVWEKRSPYAVSKRTLTICLLLAVVATLGGYIIRHPDEPAAPPPVSDHYRHQIYGDPALMDELEASGFAPVFKQTGDRILAYYAQPGREVPKSVNAAHHADEIVAALERPCAPPANARREYAELCAIVDGIKEELRAYLAAGDTVEHYLEALVARQEEERTIYERVARELANEKDAAVRETKNEYLRTLGLKTVPRPREKDKAN